MISAILYAMPGRGHGVEHAERCIRDAIVEGRYRPGERLVEQRIAQDLELSRTPVREALRRLEADGLVRSEPNRGATVRPVTAEDILDVYELRALLESHAARRAATRAGPEQVARMHVALAGFDRAVPAVSTIEGVRELHRCNEAFHVAVVEAARDERLLRMLRRTVDIPLVFQAFRRFGPREARRSSVFHHLVLEAVAGGEADRAGRLMTEHILQGRDVLLRVRAFATEDLFDRAVGST